MTVFWQNWLRVVSLILVAYGVMMALVVLPPMQDLLRWMIDLVLEPSAAAGPALSERMIFLTGIAGAMLMGWGLLTYFVATHGLNSGANWAGRAIVTSLTVWFVVDNIVSFEVGAYVNIASNTVFAVLFALPFIAGAAGLAEAGREA